MARAQGEVVTMEIFRVEAWRDLYVMIGTSSAALIGLLYVVTSLHLNEIVNNVVYRTRARSNAIFLIIALIQSAFILTPQPMWLLGVELTALNLFGWSFPIRNSYLYYIKQRDLGKSGGLSPYRAAAFHISFLLGTAGGLWLVGGSNWGMHIVTVSCVALLVIVAMNAWSIMLGIGQAEKVAKEHPKK
jgi:hypothetical protein